ncbi:FtsK/SpoIIIE domain-containing protein [Leptolyngbya sp. AN03gr2]
MHHYSSPDYDPRPYVEQALGIQDPCECLNALLGIAEQIYEEYRRTSLPYGTALFKQMLIPYFDKLRQIRDTNIRGQYSRALVTISANFDITKQQLQQTVQEFQHQAETTTAQSPPSLSTPAFTQVMTHAPIQSPVTQSEPPIHHTGHSGITDSWATSPASQNYGSTTQSPNSNASQVTGKAIASVFQKLGHPSVAYIPEEFGENAKFFKFAYSYAVGATFQELSKCAKELTQAGLDPEEVKVVQVPNAKFNGTPMGRFEVHVPKTEGDLCLTLKWLYEKLGGPKNLRSLEKRAEWIVLNAPSAKPNTPLITTFGLDLNNRAIEINQEEGVFSVGSGRSGKSTSYISRVTESLIFRGQDLLEIFAISMKKVTFAPFKDLIHVINDAEAAMKLLDALSDEADRRDELFTKIGVNSILQYNTVAMTQEFTPLPFLWVIIDEVHRLRRKSKSPDQIKQKLQELTGYTRQFGIYWDVASQYASEEYAISPATRNNLSEKILFACDEQAVGLVMSDREAKNLAPSLLSEGDALLKVLHRRRQLTRAQSFYIPDDPERNDLADFLRILKLHRPALRPSRLMSMELETPPVVAPCTNGTLDQSLDDGWFSNPVANQELKEREREKAKFNLIQDWKAHNENPANGQNKIPIRRMHAAVYGDILCPEFSHQPVETIQDLIRVPTLDKTDPRTKTYENGGNEETAKRYVQALLQKYSSTAAA